MHMWISYSGKIHWEPSDSNRRKQNFKKLVKNVVLAGITFLTGSIPVKIWQHANLPCI